MVLTWRKEFAGSCNQCQVYASLYSFCHLDAYSRLIIMLSRAIIKLSMLIIKSARAIIKFHAHHQVFQSHHQVLHAHHQVGNVKSIVSRPYGAKRRRYSKSISKLQI